MTSIVSASPAALDADLEIEVVAGGDAVARAERDWRSIARQGGIPTPFQSLELASACAAAHRRRDETPHIVIARRRGRPVAIVPLVITKSMGTRVLRFLGDPLIQYGDVIAALDARDEDIAAAFQAALSPDVAAVALLRRVRDDARAAAYLRAHATSMRMQQTALVDLSEASTLSARNRRELRRLRRRLEELGPVDIRFPTGEEAEGVLLQALRLKRAWMEEHGLASAVIGNADWEPALLDMFGAGALRVAALTVGGRLAAAELALCDESCWYAFLGAFDPHFAKMGPGHVLTDACLSRARSEGRSCYDQLPPLQAYKREQATHIVDVRDYAISFSAQGRLIAAAAGLIPEFKNAFANLPPGLRRGILTLVRQ